MRSILQEKTQEDHPFIVHYLRSSALMEEVPLQKATKVCPDRPILVISMTDGYVKARCTVPKVYFQYFLYKSLKYYFTGSSKLKFYGSEMDAGVCFHF